MASLVVSSDLKQLMAQIGTKSPELNIWGKPVLDFNILTFCRVPTVVSPSRIADLLNHITNSRSSTHWLRSGTFVIHFILTLPSNLLTTEKVTNEKWVESRIILGLSTIPCRVQSWRYGWYQCLYWVPVNPHWQREDQCAGQVSTFSHRNEKGERLASQWFVWNWYSGHDRNQGASVVQECTSAQGRRFLDWASQRLLRFQENCL